MYSVDELGALESIARIMQVQHRKGVGKVRSDDEKCYVRYEYANCQHSAHFRFFGNWNSRDDPRPP